MTNAPRHYDWNIALRVSAEVAAALALLVWLGFALCSWRLGSFWMLQHQPQQSTVLLCALPLGLLGGALFARRYRRLGGAALRRGRCLLGSALGLPALLLLGKLGYGTAVLLLWPYLALALFALIGHGAGPALASDGGAAAADAP